MTITLMQDPEVSADRAVAQVEEIPASKHEVLSSNPSPGKREGKGREGKGREGKGREGKGREGGNLFI
jgi:hypothetical protein